MLHSTVYSICIPVQQGRTGPTGVLLENKQWLSIKEAVHENRESEQ